MTRTWERIWNRRNRLWKLTLCQLRVSKQSQSRELPLKDLEKTTQS